MSAAAEKGATAPVANAQPGAIADLLFEIGVEELPSSYVPPALEQLEREARVALAELRLAFREARTVGTPRRLTLIVEGLATRQTDHEEEATGPAVRVAYDAEGQPTRALLGFCQGKGVDPSEVRRVETPKGEYVAVTVKMTGQPALDVLPAPLAAIAARLQFPKSMRWLADADVRFARPVRWLLALLGAEVVPVRAFGLSAGRSTFGHRFLAPASFELREARDYFGALEKAKVIVDHRARAERIRTQLDALASEAGAQVRHDPELLEINNFLTEWPTAFSGSFDPKYAVLPPEVIVTALREHQRFFALEAREGGSLVPGFLAVRNGDERGLDRVRRGNEEVLTSRLQDALFYWETDVKQAPAARVEALASVVWMENLGSLKDKAERLADLGYWLAARLAPETADTVRRAARLSKTDLLSEMIGSGKEYAGLQGMIGGYYAREAGEPKDVQDAIYWHYHPRFAGDDLPKTAAAAMVSLADKLDHVAGAFVAGKIPSGSEDPYGVRRAGNGVVRILIDQERHLDLFAASMESTRTFFAADPQLPHAMIMKKLGEFWRGRVELALDERGVPYDTRDAALEARVPAGDVGGARRPGWADPADALARAWVLSEFRGDQRFEPLVVLFKRVGNIVKAATEALPDSLDRARLTEDAERALIQSLDRARDRTGPLWERRAYREILPALLEMEEVIHAFFDRVLVNAEDLGLRVQRLKLLSEVHALFVRGWDLSKVVVAGASEGNRAPGAESGVAGRA